MPNPNDGTIGHAEIKIGDSVVMLADEHPQMGYRGPKRWAARRCRCCCTSTTSTPWPSKRWQPAPRSCGRWTTSSTAIGWGTFEDPFGHVWSIATHVEDVTPEEMEKRAPPRR